MLCCAFVTRCTAVVPPVPIFGVKRPRQALLAHPNNYAHDIAEPQPAGIVVYHVHVKNDFSVNIGIKMKQIKCACAA